MAQKQQAEGEVCVWGGGQRGDERRAKTGEKRQAQGRVEAERSGKRRGPGGEKRQAKGGGAGDYFTVLWGMSVVARMRPRMLYISLNGTLSTGHDCNNSLLHLQAQ